MAAFQAVDLGSIPGDRINLNYYRDNLMDGLFPDIRIKF
jgi:hypothetical protein